MSEVMVTPRYLMELTFVRQKPKRWYSWQVFLCDLVMEMTGSS